MLSLPCLRLDLDLELDLEKSHTVLDTARGLTRTVRGSGLPGCCLWAPQAAINSEYYHSHPQPTWQE